MDTQLFKSSKLKIERANKHIAELNAALGEYVKNNVYHLGTQIQPTTGHELLHLVKTTPLPHELPLIVGDVVHNLHTALDMVIWQIIPPAYRRTDVKFPFYKTREELEGQVNKGKIKTYAPKLADLIITEIKPYIGGNDSLYGLHRLDVRDKHQLLVLVEEKIDLVRASAEISGSGSFDNLNIFIQNLMELNTIADLRNVKITNYGKPTFTIVFGKGQPFESQSVIPMLHQLSELVSGCLDNCETICGTDS